MKEFFQRILQDFMKKNDTWNIRLLVDESFVPSAHRPSKTVYYIVDWRIFRWYWLKFCHDIFLPPLPTTVLFCCKFDWVYTREAVTSSNRFLALCSRRVKVFFRTYDLNYNNTLFSVSHWTVNLRLNELFSTMKSTWAKSQTLKFKFS